MKKKHTAIIDVRIQSDDFDVTKENNKLQNDEPGAIVNFVGIVRGFDEKKNESIKSLTLEHYPGMTELEIENIVKEKKLTHMDAVLWYCHKNGIEPDKVSSLITKALKEKIENNARELNFLPKTAQLPI